MVRNYYKLAVRQLVRSRSYALLNIFGLATGIAFTLLIAAYCWKEWRVNRQLKDADRQCILTSEWKDPNMGYAIATLGPLAKELKDKYPSLVANYYRFDSRTSTISYGNKYFRGDVAIGDSTLLGMYGFSLLHGDPRTALREPFSVVIMEDMAMKYFGNTDVVGKNLAIDSANVKKDFRITGVMRTPERNSVTRLNRANDNKFFVPTANETFFNRNRDWQNISIASYVELQKGVSPGALKIPIAQLIKTNTTATISNNLQVRAIPLESYYLTGGADGGIVMSMLYYSFFYRFFYPAHGDGQFRQSVRKSFCLTQEGDRRPEGAGRAETAIDHAIPGRIGDPRIRRHGDVPSAIQVVCTIVVRDAGKYDPVPVGLACCGLVDPAGLCVCHRWFGGTLSRHGIIGDDPHRVAERQERRFERECSFTQGIVGLPVRYRDGRIRRGDHHLPADPSLLQRPAGI